MSSVVPFIVFAVLAVVVVVVAVGSAKLARERGAGLARLAESRGWRFEEGDSYSYANEFPFWVFNQGANPRACNTIWGSFEVAGYEFSVRAGDFSYEVTTSDGKHTTTSRPVFSYVLVQLPFAFVPDLEIRRESLIDRMTQAMRFEDIDFESEEFSRKFVVRCKDRKFAYDVVTPRMMEVLLASDQGGIVLSNGWACVTDLVVWQPDHFADAIRFAEAFFGLWPEFVFEALAAHGSRRGAHG